MARTRDFYPSPEYGRNRRELDQDITAVQCESIGRDVNLVDNTDQKAREANLREARDRLN